jgi:hypothetical protein
MNTINKISEKQYKLALEIVKLYEKQIVDFSNVKTFKVKGKTYINLYQHLSIRTINGIERFFINYHPTIFSLEFFDISLLKEIDMGLISLQRNFGARSLFELKQFLTTFEQTN